MADPKLYISVFNDGKNDLYIKDSEARAEIDSIKSSITGAMHYIGVSTTAIADGDSTGPWTINSKTYIASGTPAEGQVLLKAGDVAVYAPAGKTEMEYVWSGTQWQEFGSTGSLKALAFKDSATGSVTAAGSNADSTVSFASGAGSDFVTGFNDDAVAPTFTEGQFTPASLAEGFATAGSAAQFTEGAFTPAQFQAGFYSEGTAPSFTEGAFTPAEIQTGFVTPGSAATFTEGAFSAGTLPSMTYDSANEKLTFAAGTLPSKAADTFSGGTPTAIDTTKFSGGSKASDSFSAGTVTTIDTTKFSGGSKASDTFVANVPTAIDTTKFSGGSKAADSFSAGSAATPTTAKALTASDTGTAAGQTFTGSAVSVTVS